MSAEGRRAVFLDRDGVLNRAIVRNGKPYSPRTQEELEVLPGVETAICALRKAGFVLIVVTNQPDIARGRMSRAALDAMHGRLLARLPLDEILVCAHDDADDCPCRKPRPGMLRDAAARWVIDLKRSILVGDRWRDISAGCAAGCRTFLIGDGYGEAFPHPPDTVASSLLDVTRRVLQDSDGETAWACSRT